MRILQAPSNVANQSTSIAAGLRSAGHHVKIWNYGPSPNGFDVDRELNPETLEEYVDVVNASIAEHFDVYHFHTTRSLMPAKSGIPMMWDLPLLRGMGKRVIFSFHGSDIRKASHHIAEDEWSFYRFADIPCDEEKIDTRLRIVRTFAHRMTVSSVLDRVYAPEASYLPKSLDLSRYLFTARPRVRRPVVLHATRRRATKGTDIIEQQLERLSSRYDFEARIIEGASHAQLLDEIQEADIVIEKLLGGDAGVLSLEAMALGRVAVARIRPEVLAQHPSMPVVNANPNTFEEVLGELLSDPVKRAEIGEAGRRYVEIDHSTEVAARTLQAIYESAKPSSPRPHPDWGSDPSPRRLESAHERIAQLEAKVARLQARM